MQKDDIRFQEKNKQADIADLSDEQAGVYELSDEQLESVHGCGGGPLDLLSGLTGKNSPLGSLGI
jgi:hypothetical protein